MEGAARLGVGIIQSHIGVTGEDPSDARYAIMVKSLEEIGRFAEGTGVVFASETGPESPAALRRFLDKLSVPAIKVNYDPANLVMNDFDQIGGVAELKDYIVHSHAKDGLRNSAKDGYKEVPVGKGDVNFPLYVSAMDGIGFDGFYTIEREGGDNFVNDIRDAKAYLAKF
jgi:sugar phosphate isomerase/epimerase